jgi:hypothetical protein
LDFIATELRGHRAFLTVDQHSHGLVLRDGFGDIRQDLSHVIQKVVPDFFVPTKRHPDAPM